MIPGAIEQRFSDAFGLPSEFVINSPGRINLIGDHTDYNDGFVLPLAIDRQVQLAARRRTDRLVVARSETVDEPVMFDLADLSHGGPPWGEYIKGVVNAFEYRGPGLDLLIATDLPVGAGLSSSAALELGMARAMAAANGDGWDPVAAARLCQRAENDWVGNACGIMDQLVVANGVMGGALLIDCRSLEWHPYPLPDRLAVVALDTGTRRQLVDSDYNERRQACDRAAKAFKVQALRDVTKEMIDQPPEDLSDTDQRRARHVVGENARVLAATEALQHEDFDTLGRLLVESHRSLQIDFEVSTTELDQMVELAIEQPGCIGARMTGAGFGGCAVALVERRHAQQTADTIMAEYRRLTGIEPQGYLCQAVAGTSVRSS